MPLILAGGGLGPEIDSIRLIELIKRSDLVYVDTYTAPEAEWLLEEARRLGGSKKVFRASRSLLEENIGSVLELAMDRTVLILVPVDPLIATTHISIILEASKRGIQWKILPGTSGVISAIVASGLQFYKFGRTVTVPGPWRKVKAYSVIEFIYCNLEKGLHTLLLLDYIEGKSLDPWEAAKTILELEEELSKEENFYPLLSKLIVMIIERAGLEDEKVVWSRIGKLAFSRHTSKPPTSLIIPGHIHPTEAEVLKEVFSMPTSIIDEHNRILTTIMRTKCFPRRLEEPL